MHGGPLPISSGPRQGAGLAVSSSFVRLPRVRDIEPTNCPGREKGLQAQYWGASVDRAKEIYWLLRKFSHTYMRVTR